MNLTELLISRMMEKRANAAAFGLINPEAIRANVELNSNKVKQWLNNIKNHGIKEAWINQGYTPEERRRLWENTTSIINLPFVKNKATKIDSATRKMFEKAIEKNPDIINSPYFMLGGNKGHIINQQWKAYKKLMEMPPLK